MGVALSWAEHAAGVLARHGFRSGGARKSVVALLAEQNCCLTVQEMHERLRCRRPVGLASVYRAVEQLAQLGLVQRIDVGDGIARYERVDPAGEHHHHAVCDDCGRVEAFHDPELEQAIRRAAGRVGFDGSHEILLRGACEDCGEPS